MSLYRLAWKVFRHPEQFRRRSRAWRRTVGQAGRQRDRTSASNSAVLRPALKMKINISQQMTSHTFLSFLRRGRDVYPDATVQHMCFHLATCKSRWSHSRGSTLPRSSLGRPDPYRRRGRPPSRPPSRRSRRRRRRRRTDRRPAASSADVDRRTSLQRASSSLRRRRVTSRNRETKHLLPSKCREILRSCWRARVWK